MNRYEGKVALISGGLGGFGLAIAQRIVSEGGKVMLGDLASADLAAMEGKFPANAVPPVVELNVTLPESWKNAVEQTLEKFGRLDLVVNNAGVTSPERTRVDEVLPDEWRRVQAVNVDGTFFGIQAALRVMKTAPSGGAIVNIGSIVAAGMSMENHEAYSTSKSAVLGLTRAAAMSAAKLGYHVRVNCVHPGTVWTPLLSRKWTKQHGSEEKAKEYMRSLTPMQTIVEAADIASAVAFLGSDDARMITGAELVVDAGHTLQAARLAVDVLLANDESTAKKVDVGVRQSLVVGPGLRRRASIEGGSRSNGKRNQSSATKQHFGSPELTERGLCQS